MKKLTVRLLKAVNVSVKLCCLLGAAYSPLALSSMVSNTTSESLPIEHNPGQLSAYWLTEQQVEGPTLVLLHGCGQTATGFAERAGFLHLATERHVAIVGIEQSKSNNVQACFNWFSESDNRAGQGEFASIESVLTQLKSVKPEQPIYLVGLSAGGAMASAVLLQRPELFDGAAVVAGVSYPCANNLIQAISCMKNGNQQEAKQLAAAVSEVKTANHWPQLLVFTGDSDAIVNPKNAMQITKQYVYLNNIDAAPVKQLQIVDGLSEQRWEKDNQAVVSLYTYEGVGHGIAIDKQTSKAENVPFYIRSQKGVVSVLMDTWFHK